MRKWILKKLHGISLEKHAEIMEFYAQKFQTSKSVFW